MLNSNNLKISEIEYTDLLLRQLGMYLPVWCSVVDLSSTSFPVVESEKTSFWTSFVPVWSPVVDSEVSSPSRTSMYIYLMKPDERIYPSKNHEGQSLGTIERNNILINRQCNHFFKLQQFTHFRIWKTWKRPVHP